MADKRTPEQIAGELRAQAAEQAQREGMRSALETERLGYVNRAAAAKVAGDKGLEAQMADRVKQVDAQLKLYSDGAGDGSGS